MKHLLTLITLFMIGCGEQEMAKIGEETSLELLSTNVTDDTPYLEHQLTSISCNSSASSFIIKNGELFFAGSNQRGQGGVGDTTDRDTFVSTGLTNVRSVHTGLYYTYVIKQDNTLWATGMGSAFFGKYIVDTSSFVQVKIKDVKMVSVGDETIAILKNNGTLWMAGRNKYGEAGLGHNNSVDVFTNVGLSGVSYISMGSTHSAIVKDGYIWTTGNNTYGELGLGDNVDKNVFTNTNRKADFVTTGTSNTFAIDHGDLWGTGRNTNAQLGISDKLDKKTFQDLNVSNALDVGAGFAHTVVLKNDNSIVGAGSNFVGELGLDTTSEATGFTTLSISGSAIAVGYNTTLVKTSTTVFGTGYNGSGELGLGDTTIRTTFTNTSQIVDTYSRKYWTYFYPEDIVRIENDLYLVTLLQDTEPSIFVTFMLLGKVNQYKPFDEANITFAARPSPMTYTVRGLEPFNSFSLAKVKGTSVSYVFKNSSGTTIKSETRLLDCSRDANGYLSQYPTTVILYADQQMEINSTVEITITNSLGDVELGNFSLNNTIDTGFTNLDFSHQNQDWNTYTPDAFGNISEGNKPITTIFNVTLDVVFTNYDNLVRYTQSVVGKNVIIDASDSDGEVADSKTIFASLTRRGRISNFTLKSQVKDGELDTLAKASLTFKEVV